ncbi:MAG: DNA primase [Phycisphaerales bacterium JB059]
MGFGQQQFGQDGLDDRQRVRDASDIVAVIGQHLSLKAKGREYACLCPFHDDHNPSMSVVPHKQIFHCFVCGAGGDVFTFVQRYHNMDFREALEFLAERAGIELTRRKPQARSEAGSDEPSRRDLIEANRVAADFFRAILTHPEHGALAREVIERRRIAPEMVETFSIGASPNRWDGLLQTVQSKGLNPAHFLGAGLIKPKENGGAYDALRNRLIFPIHEHPTGRVIAFGARRLDDEDEPKYLNSPETPVFNKSKTLFGLHQAARSIQREGVAIIVEGYTDVIACHQAGITNVVGTLGTALTTQHAAVLRRLCDAVVLLFDADEAGQRAADRALEVMFSEEIDIRVGAGGDGAKDPDELLRSEGGVERFHAMIAGATDLLEFRFSRLRARLRGAGMAETSRVLGEEMERLNEMGLDRVRPLRKQFIIRELAHVAGVDEQIVREAMPGGRRSAPRPEAQIENKKDVLSRSLNAREGVLGSVLCDPAVWLAIGHEDRDLLAAPLFESEALRAVADAVHLLDEDGRRPALSEVLAELESAEAQSAAVELERMVSVQTGGGGERFSSFWRDCLDRLRATQRSQGTTEHVVTTEGGGDAPMDDDLARLLAIGNVHKELGKNPAARLLGD